MKLSTASLELAWKRMKADQIDRVFVRSPYEIALIDSDRQAWLSALRDRLAAGGYHPQSMDICDVPKSPVMVRPGGLLSVTDSVVFAAAVGECLPQLIQAMKLPERMIDLSNQLSPNPDKPNWLRNRFECWKSFRDESLKALTPEITCVVVADISGFFENVDIPILISDLKGAGAPHDPVTLLNSCLRKWAHVSDRSIPQGHSAGDILAKFYLHPVDAALALNYRHLRFVDDFRIFCQTRTEALRAIVELTRLLRSRGLVLNSAKSQIYLASDAMRMIDGAIPIIESVRESVVEQITQSLGSSYVKTSEATSVLGTAEADIPLDLVEHTFKAYFVDAPLVDFQRSLFHFLLTRLGHQRSNLGVDYCLSILGKHPGGNSRRYSLTSRPYATHKPTMTNWPNCRSRLPARKSKSI